MSLNAPETIITLVGTILTVILTVPTAYYAVLKISEHRKRVPRIRTQQHD